MIELREYQRDVIAKSTRDRNRQAPLHRRCPTGGGKTSSQQHHQRAPAPPGKQC